MLAEQMAFAVKLRGYLEQLGADYRAPRSSDRDLAFETLQNLW